MALVIGNTPGTSLALSEDKIILSVKGLITFKIFSSVSNKLLSPMRQFIVIGKMDFELLAQLFLAYTETSPAVVPNFTMIDEVFCPLVMVLPVGTNHL